MSALGWIATQLATGVVTSIGGDIYVTILGDTRQIVDLSRKAYEQIGNIVGKKLIDKDIDDLESLLVRIRDYNNDPTSKQLSDINTDATKLTTRLANYDYAHKIAQIYLMSVSLRLWGLNRRMELIQSGEFKGDLEGAKDNLGRAAFRAAGKLLAIEANMLKKEGFTFFEFAEFKYFAATGEKCSSKVFEKHRHPQEWFGDSYSKNLLALYTLIRKYNTGGKDYNGDELKRAPLLYRLVFGTDHNFMKHIWSNRWVTSGLELNIYRCQPTPDGFYPIGDIAFAKLDKGFPAVYVRDREKGALLNGAGYGTWSDKSADREGNHNGLTLLKPNLGKVRDARPPGYAAFPDYGKKASDNAFKYIARIPDSHLDRREKVDISKDSLLLWPDNAPRYDPVYGHYPIIRWADVASGADDDIYLQSVFVESRGRIRTCAQFTTVGEVSTDIIAPSEHGYYTRPKFDAMQGVWVDRAPPLRKPANWRKPKDQLPVLTDKEAQAILKHKVKRR